MRLTRNRISVAIGAIALLHSPTLLAESVSITNPSFESSSQFEGWVDVDPSFLSGVAYDGTKAVKISGSGGSVEQTVNLQTDTTYTLSAFIKGAGTIGLRIGGQVYSQKVSGNSDWAELTVSANSGSQTQATVFAEYNGAEGRFDSFTLNSSASNPSTPPAEPGSCDSPTQLTIASAKDDGTHDGHGPENAIDNNLTTESRWSSQGIGKQIVFDLQANATVTSLDVIWLKGDQRSSYFEVATSSDNTSWTPVLSGASSSGAQSAYESYELTESQARYIRITGQGNSANNWNSIIEAKAFGCSDGSAPVDPVDPVDPVVPVEPSDPNLNPSLAPSGNFDLLDWTLSVPVDEDSDGKADTVKEQALSSGYTSNEFFYTASDGGMVFKAPISGAKTSSSTSYTRSELREMLRRGNTSYSTKGVGKNNWVFSSAPSSAKDQAGGVNGVLDANLAVNHVTTSGDSGQVGRVIVGQIHANDDEPVRLYYRKLPNNQLGSIYIAHEPRSGSEKYYEMIGSRSNSASNPSDGIALDERFSYQIKVVANTLTVTISRPDKADVVQTVDMSNSGYDNSSQYMYFKAGVYNQNKSGDGDDYVQATFYSLSNTHDGYNY
ncbi:polysaccharide lyase family 7 protein [Agarivorans aestuarii]|uniref:Polysaccharide lyase family 7 protein n=1 Tax=Agarivorans aestuarii TaxID=1563703 RepID=A0ABU7G180_9ALTE|nr:polysaccharide lyase family 7 protein [Agarivorans aestuarii]MEE1673080.1 polysaccharide lyase family 7 protein [Agarivorans aestuarii]